MSEVCDEQVESVVSGSSRLAYLLRKMRSEKDNEQRANALLDKLQHFISNREDSELKGLEEKLKAVGRGSEFQAAERDLQWFEETLDKYTYYQSAQQVLLYFLSRILHVFETKIMPEQLNLTYSKVNEIIETDIIQPTLKEMDEVGGHDLVLIDEADIRGMINWLAERCHIRWQAC